MTRVFAVDWSRAQSGVRSKIWLAEVRDGLQTRLESGRDRREVLVHVMGDATADPDVVVGLDFAFSFPRWYTEQLAAPSIQDLWSLVVEQGEDRSLTGLTTRCGRAAGPRLGPGPVVGHSNAYQHVPEEVSTSDSQKGGTEDVVRRFAADEPIPWPTGPKPGHADRDNTR